MRDERPVVFIDRDGTLIVERQYLQDHRQVELELGVVEGLAALRQRNAWLFVISNQSGVGRGLFSMDAVVRVNQRIAELLLEHGIILDGWYICPHLPYEGCACRKPRPALALQACREHRIDLQFCSSIGDKESDAQLARSLGGYGVLIVKGCAASKATPAFAIASDFWRGTKYILKKWDERLGMGE
jgi:histidinol-phosphate phosphatase family protein